MVFWPTTEQRGRLGMTTAAILLLIFGCWICLIHRPLGGPLVTGGIVVALGQFVPILQFTAIMIGVNSVGLIQRKGFDSPQAFSELTSFISTAITGGILLAESAACGLMIRAFSPQHWWGKRARRDSFVPRDPTIDSLLSDSLAQLARYSDMPEQLQSELEQTRERSTALGRIVTFQDPGLTE